MAITFSVPGEPVPQPRPRVSTRGGFARAYVPKDHSVHHYRKCIEACAVTAGLRPTGEPLKVEILAVFERPKSHLNKSGLKPTAPRLPRPDADNLAKSVLDALQNVIGDDTCVARLVVEKSYGKQACTIVTVSDA